MTSFQLAMLFLDPLNSVNHLSVGRIASRMDSNPEPHAVEFLHFKKESVIGEEGHTHAFTGLRLLFYEIGDCGYIVRR
mgnify:CR=1 FL=1